MAMVGCEEAVLPKKPARTPEPPKPPEPPRELTVTVSPADGTVVADAGTEIVFTFSEAVYRDASGGVFDASSLAAVVVLKEINASGTDIAFTASISSDHRVVTVAPNAGLSEGVVHVGLAGVYDKAGNQISAVSQTFTVRVLSEPTVVLKDPSRSFSFDSTPTLTVTVDAEYQNGVVQLFADGGCFTALSAAVAVDEASEDVTTNSLAEGTYTIYTRHTSGSESVCTSVPVSYTYAAPTELTVAVSPADGTVVADTGTDVTLRFSEAVYRDASGGLFDEISLAAVLVLKETNGSGSDIEFAPSISSDNTVVTIDPTGDLPEGNVYLAVAKGFYGRAGNQLAAVSQTFTVRVLSEPTVVLKDPSRSFSSDSTPTLTVTVDPEYQSGTVQLFSDSGCFTALSGVVTVDAAYEEVTTEPLTEGTYTIYTRHTSSGESVCTAVPVSYTYEGTAPTATIAPADGTVVADVETDIVFTFSEAVYRDRNGGLFDETSLAAVVVLKETNAGSADIAFSASISLDNRVVTVDPDADLPEGVVYAAVTGNFYDEVGGGGPGRLDSPRGSVKCIPLVVNLPLPLSNRWR